MVINNARCLKIQCVNAYTSILWYFLDKNLEYYDFLKIFNENFINKNIQNNDLSVKLHAITNLPAFKLK